MSKLEELIEMCKCEVSVVVNEHTVYYEDLKEYLETRDTELSDAEINEIVSHKRLVEVIVYPDTPVGNYCIYGYDIEMVAKELIDIILEDRGITL
jgi:hypothetical protein